MLAAKRRRPQRAALVLALVASLPLATDGICAAQPTARAGGAPCQAMVTDFLAHAPLIRRSDESIVRLLDQRRYRQAAAALRGAVNGYPNPWAGYALGNLYAAGLGVPRSADTAFRWYLWSAKRGDRFAQREVANAYLHGQGTRRDAAKAAYWFRIGVAPFQLARMYYSLSGTYARGHLAPVNRDKAAYYLDKSIADLRTLAKEPNGEAAYYLGLAYEHGDGVPRNRAKADTYLCRAASLRYPAAIYAISRLQGHPR